MDWDGWRRVGDRSLNLNCPFEFSKTNSRIGSRPTMKETSGNIISPALVNGFWDRTGATVSWLCAIHCILTPLLFSVAPVLGISFLANEGVEYSLIGLSIFVATLSLFPAYRRIHRRIDAILLFIGGISFVIAADILFEESPLGNAVFVVVGAGQITLAHYWNHRLCAKSACKKS